MLNEELGRPGWWERGVDGAVASCQVTERQTRYILGAARRPPPWLAVSAALGMFATEIRNGIEGRVKQKRGAVERAQGAQELAV